MRKRKVIKKVASKLPVTKKFIVERERLYSLNNELLNQNNVLQKRLDKNIRDRNNPKLTQDYKFASDPLYRIVESDIEESKKVTLKKIDKIRTANWFIPSFQHISFGGLYTIFRFVEKLSQEDVVNRIIIYNDSQFNKKQLSQQIEQNFKNLNNYEIIAFDYKSQKLDQLPESDLAFCTIWDSAYILLRFNRTKRKYYFIQDYEPLFFPAGSISALAESTYRFGFRGIVNTTGLLKAVQERHGMDAISFTPGIDRNIYYPSRKKNVNKKIKIFFYGRPSKPRNAFNLGVETIQQLIEKYGNKIEIVTAGAEWDESLYGLNGKIKNLGLLKTIDEVATLYRKCDIGFCFMLTRHPSYQPIEFMASGMATVTNMNESNLWLLKNNENCLISEPSPKAMAQTVGKLIENQSLRKQILNNGYKTINKLSWTPQINSVWDSIKEW